METTNKKLRKLKNWATPACTVLKVQEGNEGDMLFKERMDENFRTEEMNPRIAIPVLSRILTNKSTPKHNKDGVKNLVTTSYRRQSRLTAALMRKKKGQ